MISGLWNGVSGLNTYEKALSTHSHNATNANTIGYKKDRISFEDMMYESRYGKGVNVQSVDKIFSQGGIKYTNNNLDVAIEGDGFFIVKDPILNKNYYTRTGNFHFAKDGTLETVDGKKVLGSASTISQVVSSDDNKSFDSTYDKFIAFEPISTKTFSQTINARASDYEKSAVASGISGQGFKKANSKIADIELLIRDYNNKLDLYSSNPKNPGKASASQVTQIDFADFNSVLTDKSFMEIFVNENSIRQKFDTDAQTTINKFADKISTFKGLSATVDDKGLLTINTLIPGVDVDFTSPAIDSKGYGVNEITSPLMGEGIAMVNSSRDALKKALENANAKFLEITNNVTYQDADLSSLSPLQLKLENLDIAKDTFGQISIEEGIVYSKDGENKFALGKLESANFINPDSLEPQGDNLYALGVDTSKPKSANNINNIIGGAVELSNVNIGDDLVNLMVYQKAFEANSKSITTSDELLKTAIQLKK